MPATYRTNLRLELLRRALRRRDQITWCPLQRTESTIERRVVLVPTCAIFGCVCPGELYFPVRGKTMYITGTQSRCVRVLSSFRSPFSPRQCRDVSSVVDIFVFISPSFVSMQFETAIRKTDLVRRHCELLEEEYFFFGCTGRKPNDGNTGR